VDKHQRDLKSIGTTLDRTEKEGERCEEEEKKLRDELNKLKDEIIADLKKAVEETVKEDEAL